MGTMNMVAALRLKRADYPLCGLRPLQAGKEDSGIFSIFYLLSETCTLCCRGDTVLSERVYSRQCTS